MSKKSKELKKSLGSEVVGKKMKPVQATPEAAKPAPKVKRITKEEADHLFAKPEKFNITHERIEEIVGSGVVVRSRESRISIWSADGSKRYGKIENNRGIITMYGKEHRRENTVVIRDDAGLKAWLKELVAVPLPVKEKKVKAEAAEKLEAKAAKKAKTEHKKAAIANKKLQREVDSFKMTDAPKPIKKKAVLDPISNVTKIKRPKHV